MRILMIAPLTLAVLAAGCGETRTQKAATGGVGGAAVGAVAGGPVGALIGAGVGAAGGAYREEGDAAVDRVADRAQAEIGGETRPQAGSGTAQQPMEHRSGALRAPASDLTNEQVRKAQTSLKDMGLYDGRIDGLYGPRTIRAVRQFQERQDLRQTGALDEKTRQELEVAATKGGPAGETGRPAATEKPGAQPAEEPRSTGPREMEQHADQPEQRQQPAPANP